MSHEENGKQAASAPDTSGARYHIVNRDEIEAAQLDGRPIYSPSEMPDTSALASLRHISANTARGAQTTGRRSHIMSWNNYDTDEAASAPSTLSPRLVSPESSPENLSGDWTNLR